MEANAQVLFLHVNANVAQESITQHPVVLMQNNVQMHALVNTVTFVLQRIQSDVVMVLSVRNEIAFLASVRHIHSMSHMRIFYSP